MYYLDPLGYVGQHYQPSNMFVAKKNKKYQKKSETKAHENAKAAQFALFLQLCCFFFVLFSWDHFCTYENFYPVSNIYAPRKKMRK